ncbi:hypothetical protein [Maribacter aestuarii]|uniref:hypothetical protein n=1 Tax=Maribacter aestuarii TaxID=1130723 RepID=UPI00248BC635|nr:hypothetical protein [Maribacter aestuarii]
MERKKLRKKWLFMGGIGASLFGFGLCCLVESGFLKYGDAPWYQWVLAGTVSLCIVMFGLILLLKASSLENQLKKND